MSIFVSLFYLVILLHASVTSSAHQAVEWSRSLKGDSRRHLQEGSCRTGNPIDDCWRCDPEWETNRKTLANCGVGFGRNAIGGRDGEIYLVTDPSDDPLNPTPGTLRYAVIQEEPLWIIFGSDMILHLNAELVMNSHKTIDGRGVNIHLANGPCIAIQNVSNIIIHNIHIYNCLPSVVAMVRITPQHAELRANSDGDGISIQGSRDVWIDHCTMTNCRDGLIDAVQESTAITISNNYMFHHNEVMLMGHSDEYTADKNMLVTIAFNYFGEGLVQRMPRCRHGYFHIVNNIYYQWEMYAIGGSANPTINSQGNIFMASNDRSLKEVTKRESSNAEWEDWNWRSDGDLMYNGAFFTPSGQETSDSYSKASSMVARPASFLTTYTPSAGVLYCHVGDICRNSNQ